jgi:hypothetical protein
LVFLAGIYVVNLAKLNNKDTRFLEN